MRLQPLTAMVDGKVALVLVDHDDNDAYVPRLTLEPTLAAFQAANAASDMLAALEALVADFDKHVQTTDPMLIEARSAIAKARNQGPSADQE